VERRRLKPAAAGDLTPRVLKRDDAGIMKRTAKKTEAKHDWSRLDAMTEAEKHAAALSDPDNRPLTEEDMKRMKRTPRATIIRRALGLKQEV
jgi:hypothetical protein